MRAKILLVDDNAGLRADFPLWFREYDIQTAPSAEEALRALARPNDLDLVLLDVQLPGMNGLDALLKIKAAAPEKRVVIMTGYSSKDTAIHALTGHADNYIEKPFDLKAMRALIEKELGCAREDAPPETEDARGRIEHVKNFIRRNRFGRVTLKEAAAAVFLTPKYLSRLFRQVAGEGFEEFKLRVKMDEARRLLRSHENSVKHVARALGYANTESFIREFKKVVGVLPSAYRSGRKPAGKA